MASENSGRSPGGAATWWAEHTELVRTWDPAWGAAPRPLRPVMTDLLDAVEAVFPAAARAIDTDPAGWPDPHGDSLDAMPAEEEYARVTEPQRYEILGARLAAWERVLTERGLARVVDLGGGAAARAEVWVPGQAGPGPEGTAQVTVRVWEPARRDVGDADGTAADDAIARPHPLVVSAARVPLRDGSGGVLPGWTLGLGRPALVLAILPDCGCDACDTGSARLLEELDQTVVSVVTGHLKAGRGPKGTRRTDPFGSRAASGEGGPGRTASAEVLRVCAPWPGMANTDA